MRNNLAIASIAAAVFLSACAGTPFNWDDARRITPGMTTDEVTQILGAANNITSTNNELIYVWVHVNMMTASTRTLRIPFKDGKVVQPPQIPDVFKD